MRSISANSRQRVVTLTAALLMLAILPAAALAQPKLAKLRFSTQTYSVNEPTSGTTTFTATVLRSGNTSVPASVDYTTQNGSATNGVDYTATSGTLNFAAGQTRMPVTITILHNGITGPTSKSLSIKLSNGSPNSVPPGQTTATVTIFDTDGPGTIDFGSPTYSVVESAGLATVTVNRASASNLVETVDYRTTALPAGTGHATAGTDYTTTSGTLTFATGEMSKTFQVPISDDNSFEGDETLQLTLSNPKNLTSPDQPVLGSNTPATLTVVDDDVPTFAFHQATYSVSEDAGNATISVDRGGDTTIPASVNYATSDGTAVAGTDYAATSGHLDFAAGQTQASFQVPITLNGVPNEPNKTINLQLTSGGQQVGSALLSIVEADPGTTNNSVQLSNTAYSVGEAAGSVNVSVTLAHDPASDVTVQLSALNSPSDTATAGDDYTAITAQTVTFHPGDALTQDVPVQIANDSIAEDDETFTVKLSSPSSGVVLGAPSQAQVTILDDDSAGTLQFSALRYDVNETAGHATITVNRVGGSSGSASVDYATSDGTAGAPDDYAATHGTLTFADGETQKTFQIPVNWDGRQEGDETVNVQLSNFDSDDDPSLVKPAVLHIADDGASGPVQFDSSAYRVLENAGAATITVMRSGGSLGGPVTVDYAGSDGTSGTLTFGPGEASKAFTVPVADDNVHTGPRTVNLSLGNPGGGTSLGSQATATLTIGDDDPASSSSKDLTAPKLKLTVKKGQKVGKLKRLLLKVRSNEAAKLGITANLRTGKKLVRIAKASKRVGQNKMVTITLKLDKTSLAKLRAALAAKGSKGRAKITIAVTGTDVAGNRRTIRKTVSVG